MSKDLFIPRYGEAIAIEKITSDTRAIIGREVESGDLIRIGDKERCGGLYILGQPRTGKSNLLISIALTDIENCHGILFIDPHSDAINDLIARIPPKRQKDVILLDPTDKKRSFGINLLQCSNLHDPLALDETWGRVQKIFAKVWGDERGELGVWLGKILRNAVYLLLENPGYTLVEIPLLLREDTTFRNSLLANVKVNTEVKDFWYYEFDRLSRREKTEQVGPALSRLDLFRTVIVREIVGQRESTIDFQQILREEKIVLLRFPTNLARDVRNLIGTMLLSEVLHAAFERDKLPEKERSFFGIFCDEFQEFATPDFAQLFTQGKFRLMPVVVHHTRLGQFKPGDPNLGATLAAANKAFFTQSPADATELPLEFAKKPPVEIRLEEQYAISQNPVYDLLKVHHDPEICAFVDKAIRPLQERLEDIKDEIEGERLIRTDLLDQAALERIDERISFAHSGLGMSASILGRAAMATELARQQTRKMQSLLDTGKNFRQAVRDMNRFLTAVMEGKTSRGREDFSDFIVKSVRLTPFESRDLQELLEFYISLAYGDPKLRRQLPFVLAKAHGLFASTVRALEQEGEARNKKEKEDALKKELDALEAQRIDKNKKAKEIIQQYREEIRREIDSWKLEIEKEFFRRLEDVIRMYIPVLEFSSVRDVIAPLLTARLSPPWSNLLDIPQMLSRMRKEIQRFRDQTEKALQYYYWWHPPSWTFGRRFYRLHPDMPKDDITLDVFAPAMLDAFEKFIERYQEGAIIVLLVLFTFCEPRAWRKRREGYPAECVISFGYVENVSRYYWRFNMLYLPTVSGFEPLQVFLLLDKLRDTLPQFDMREACRKYMWGLPKWDQYTREPGEKYRGPEFWGSHLMDSRLEKGAYLTDMIKELEGDDGWVPEHEGKDGIKGYPGSLLRNLYTLNLKLEQNYDLLSRNKWWPGLEKLIKLYLQSRAWDIAKYGSAVADKTFPQPTLKGVTSGQVSEFVGQMAKMIEEERDKEKAEAEEKRLAECNKEIYEEHEKKFRNQLIPVPTHLEPRMFSDIERREVVGALRKELEKNDLTKAMLETVDMFARFCELLAKPENRIKVITGQFVEKEYNTRQEADMVNEVSRLLTSLPKYTVYAKIVTESRGEAGVWKGTVRTLKLTKVAADAAEKARTAVEANMSAYTKPREQIRAEIEKRQARWRQPAGAEAPPVRIEEKKPAASSEQRTSKREEEPPPISFPSKTTSEAQEPVKPKTKNNPGEGNLIYRSNFYQPDDKWAEGEPDNDKLFRRDGYYHIELNNANTLMVSLAIPVFNFKVCVDAQLVKGGDKVIYGVCFRRIKDSNGLSCYQFIFNSGSYCLLLWRNGEYKFLLEYRSCEFIRQDSINSLMVQMRGQEITLGINEHILDTITDTSLALPSYAGISVSKPEDSQAEVRFRDFRLYSLEQ